jgi:hypothetical protein
MAGTIVADQLEAASTSTLVIKNGVANTPPTIQDSAGTQIGTLCRAWVNFNGTGTVAIRASFNVSSITDNGTGDYTVNFTNAMPDANYSKVAIVAFVAGVSVCYATTDWAVASNTEVAPTTTAFRLASASGASGVDSKYISASVFR